MPTSITNPTVPTVGGSSGTWGTTLNTAVGTLYTNDSNLKATADAALPLAGGTMTGNVDLTTATMATTAKGSVSGAVTLDLSASDHFSLTVGGAITGITLSNVPASPKVAVLILEITNGGAFAITWPTSFKFPSDRKSTRLNSSHPSISYAVFCLKKKKKENKIIPLK